jgi:lipoate-protein ligase A
MTIKKKENYTNNKWRYLEVKEKEVIRCNSIHSTLVDGMIKGVSPNTVFLEECPGSVLSLGRNQCCEEECDIAECEKLGITIERRETGGGAGLMVPGSTSWGICIDKRDPRVSTDMDRNFEILSRGVIICLKKLGLDAKFAPMNDINIGDKKVGGMTAMSRHNSLLIYGSVIWDFDMDTFMKIARIPEPKLKKKGVSSVQKRITTIVQELGREIPPSELREYLIKGFEEALGIKLIKEGLNEEENEIWKRKMDIFSSKKFILRPGHCSVSNARCIYPAEKGIIRVSLYVNERTIMGAGITGDFMQINDIDFDSLERLLIGSTVDREDIERIVYAYFKENEIQMVGASADDFVDAIVGAVNEFGE